MSTYSPIATQTLTGTATSVTFSNIPQGYTDLILQVNDQLSGASGYQIQFNNDTNANYLQMQMGGYGGAGAAAKILGASSIYNNLVYGDSTTASYYTPNIIQIQNYSNSTAYKTVLWRYGTTNANAGNAESFLITGSWNSNSPITSITISVWNAVNFIAGSSFSLYGIAGGSAGPKATGGIVTTSGGYAYHTFTTSGGFIPSENLTVDYLVVAGGGGGSAGGGGAGGLRSTVTATGGGGTVESALSLTAGVTYPAVVGAGGYGSYSYSASGSERQGGNGNNSAFHIITSVGGGGGGSITYSSNPNPAMSGGSGGGATYSSGSGNYGLGTPNQGYAGGQHTNPNPPYPGSGGGGAGQLGNPPAGSNGGAGGNGVQITALATPTSTGADSGYYAGGGGGGVYGAGSTAAGGLGGGGSASGGGNVGTINTGGGGSGVSNAAIGKAGGSGIIIIRYAI